MGAPRWKSSERPWVEKLEACFPLNARTIQEIPLIGTPQSGLPTW
jgi:hypothetical protein